MNKKLLANPWTAIITLLILIVVRMVDPGFVESVRLRYFDQLILDNPIKPVPVSVVNIDEAALDQYGQFPFPRDIYGKIVTDLFKHEAGTVVFNVLMPDSDRFGKDGRLAEIITGSSTVLPSLGHTSQKNTPAKSNVMAIGNSDGKLVDYPGMISNVAQIEKAAAGVGIVNTFPEIDGVVRRMPLAVNSSGHVYPALSLEALRVHSKDHAIQIRFNDHGVDAMRIPSFGILKTDPLSRVWIDWSVETKQYSLVDLPKSFNGGLVIVGLSAAGLANPIATARGEVWPHDVQAAVIGTMLSKSNIVRPDWADAMEIFLLLALGIAVIFVSRWTYAFVPVVLVLASSHFVLNGIYDHYRILLDATWLVIGTSVVYMHAYTVKFMSEFFQKQEIRRQFQSYLSPDLVAKLIKDPSLLKLGGEEQELSILFSDVRGFTSISEHYGKDVQGLTKIMNRYMTAMTQVILENHGTLDKYIGDAQMAFWNAPIDQAWHCNQSVKSALLMLERLKEFNVEIGKEGTPPFGMGIGINTGVVVVGNMGSEQRFDYTCLGDAVNLASRLEGQSKNYGVQLVIGPVTAERLTKEYFTVELDCIAVKGKTEGVKIYTVFFTPESPAVWEYYRGMHNEMLVHYRNQEWDRAKDLTLTLISAFNDTMDHYYELWLERIETMRHANLPVDWDGVFRAQSK